MKKSMILMALFCLIGNLNAQPLDGIVERKNTKDKRVLAYQQLDERDVMWEKRIWRVLDIREKMNLSFQNPQRPFFNILMEAAMAEEITLYSVEEDDFSMRIPTEEIDEIFFKQDSVETIDPVTYDATIEVVQNQIFYEDIKRFRLKEVWYFDSRTSTMNVRILGIAPLMDVYDNNGNFLYERPLFWAYYPDCREVLTDEIVFNEGNDASPITWDDLFEMRKFSSYIYKQSDALDRPLKEMYSGVDMLMEADKIKNEILNYEMDMWSR